MPAAGPPGPGSCRSPRPSFPRPARRPANSVLAVRQDRPRLSHQPRPWREALAEVGRELAAGA